MRFALATILVLAALPLPAQEKPAATNRVVVRKLAGQGFIYLKYVSVSPEEVIKVIAAGQGWKVHLDRNMRLNDKPMRGQIERGDAMEIVRWLALAAGVEADFNEKTKVIFLHAPYQLSKESRELQEVANTLYRREAKRWLINAIAAGRGGRMEVGYYETLVELILADADNPQEFMEAEGYLKELKSHYGRSIRDLSDRLEKLPRKDPAGEEELTGHRRCLARTLVRLGQCYLADTDLSRASQAVNKFQDALSMLAVLDDRGDLFYQAKAGEIKARIRNGENVGLESLEREIERVKDQDTRNWGRLKLLTIEGYYLAAQRERKAGRADQTQYNLKACLRAYEELARNTEVVLAEGSQRDARYYGGHGAFELARHYHADPATRERGEYLYAKAINILLPLVATPGRGGIRRVEWDNTMVREMQTHLTLAQSLLVPRIAGLVKGTNCPLLALRILENVHTLERARLVEFMDVIDKNRIISTTGAYVVRWPFGPRALVAWGESGLQCLRVFGTMADQRALYEWIHDQLGKMAANIRMGISRPPAFLPAGFDRHRVTRFQLAPTVGLTLARIYLELAEEYRQLFQGDQARAQKANAMALLETMAFLPGTEFNPARLRWVELLMEQGEPREVIAGTAKVINLLRSTQDTPAGRKVLSALFALRMQAFLAEDNYRDAQLASEGKGVAP